ncbi:hypothetical protein HaLaN_31781, partial [Haematococcus lacustris]
MKNVLGMACESACDLAKLFHRIVHRGNRARRPARLIAMFRFEWSGRPVNRQDPQPLRSTAPASMPGVCGCSPAVPFARTGCQPAYILYVDVDDAGLSIILNLQPQSRARTGLQLTDAALGACGVQ